MNENPENPTTPPEITPEPTPDAAEKAKRVIDRRPQVTRILQHVKGDLWRMLPERHAGLVEAEAWIDKSAAPGLYWPGRGPEEANRVNPRAVVPEVLP